VRSVRVFAALVPEGRPPARSRLAVAGTSALLVLLWIHAVGIAVFAAVRQFRRRPRTLEAGTVAVTGPCWQPVSPAIAGLRSVVAASGLMTSSALLGPPLRRYIEFHFHFFVMVGLLALFRDWTTFILAIGYVVVSRVL